LGVGLPLARRQGGGHRKIKMTDVAKALYQLMWPSLDWPEGDSKRAKEARRNAEIAAERIGNYQQALDACYLLATNPSQDEAAWIAGAKTIYGLIDLVNRKIKMGGE